MKVRKKRFEPSKKIFSNFMLFWINRVNIFKLLLQFNWPSIHGKPSFLSRDHGKQVYA